MLHRFRQPLRLVERRRPVPRGEQVLVRVLATGVCHSDVHIADGAVSGIRLPLVLGHEVAGEVPELGPVLVYAAWGCGTCAWCRRGEEQLCPDAVEAGWGADGGSAEWMVVPSRRYLIPLGDLDPVRAAPLADAGVTPYRAVRRALPWLTEGDTALVIGIGGLGQFAVQYLKVMARVRVVAVDRDPAKLRRAAELGADETRLPGEAASVPPARAVFDFVGARRTLALAAGAVQPGGVIVQVGRAASGGKSKAGRSPSTQQPPADGHRRHRRTAGSPGSQWADVEEAAMDRPTGRWRLGGAAAAGLLALRRTLRGCGSRTRGARRAGHRGDARPRAAAGTGAGAGGVHSRR